jgi:hypothetical protein
VQIVDGNVKEALKLRIVQVHGDQVVSTCTRVSSVDVFKMESNATV